MPEFVERVKHRLRFNGAHSAAAHGIVEHAVAVLPRSFLVPVRDVVQHGGVPISSFEGPTHDRPEVTRNGGAIDNRSNRSDPSVALRIGIPQFSQQCHGSPIWIPLGHRLAIEMTPFGCPRDSLINAGNLGLTLVRGARGEDRHEAGEYEQLNTLPVSHVRLKRLTRSLNFQW